MEQNNQNRRSYSNERNTNMDQDRYNQGYGSFHGYDNDEENQNRSGAQFNRGNNDYNRQRDFGQGSNRNDDMNDSGWNNWSNQNSGRSFGQGNYEQENRFRNQGFNRGGSSDRSRDFDNFSNSNYGQRSGRNFEQNDFNQDYNSGGYGQRRNQYGNDFNRGDQDYGRYNQSQNYGRNNSSDDYGRNRNYGNFDSRYNRDNDRGWWDRTKDEVSSWFGDDDAERRRQQDEQRRDSHRGKGPKDYQRSADRIREDISDRLSDAHDVDASNIEVKVEGSEVILSGHVNSKSEKRRAEDIAEQVSGVKNVQNHLRVGQEHYSGMQNSGQSGATAIGSSDKANETTGMNQEKRVSTVSNTGSPSTSMNDKSKGHENQVKAGKVHLS